jgi:hypothetical protein
MGSYSFTIIRLWEPPSRGDGGNWLTNISQAKVPIGQDGSYEIQACRHTRPLRLWTLLITPDILTSEYIGNQVRLFLASSFFLV